MSKINRLTVIIGVVALLAIAAAAITFTARSTSAGDGDGEEPPITGDALERASEAALAATGGGTVTETEVGDEESYYEVEVTLDDGSQVDVQLDEDFNVVSSETDDENEDEGADDD